MPAHTFGHVQNRGTNMVISRVQAATFFDALNPVAYKLEWLQCFFPKTHYNPKIKQSNTLTLW